MAFCSDVLHSVKIVSIIYGVKLKHVSALSRRKKGLNCLFKILLLNMPTCFCFSSILSCHSKKKHLPSSSFKTTSIFQFEILHLSSRAPFDQLRSLCSEAVMYHAEL